MKILNLYACLGGNRKLWGDDHEITSVELDPELARLYSELYPNDKVVVADAHQYLLDNFEQYDFIWSSPPCPTHSKLRHSQSKHKRKGCVKPQYIDLKLYQEIIFLQSYAKGKWVVENVIPYYKPLIQAQKIGRHLFWSNFKIPSKNFQKKVKISAKNGGGDEVNKLCQFHGIDLTTYKGTQRKDKIARNLVDYRVGKYIFDIAYGCHKQLSANKNKITLFE